MLKPKASYYIQRILQNMSTIEDETKTLFHKYAPELEASIWDAIDNKKYLKFPFLLNQLNSLIDEIRETK